MSLIKTIWLSFFTSSLAVLAAAAPASAQQQKPNIVIIWGDDIGQSDISAYSHGLMGYRDAQHRPHRA